MSDEVFDELDDIAEAGKEAIFEVGAGIINIYDKSADLIGWIVSRSFILIARRAHNARVRLNKYRKELIQYGLGIIIVATGIIALFASITDYCLLYTSRCV